MTYHIKKIKNFEARIYIGSKVRYNGPSFSIVDLKFQISNFQKTRLLCESNTVRITATNFVFNEYEESGWEIAIINYPRNEKPEKIIRNFTFDLAVHLFKHFEQNRMSIVFPDETVMLESNNVEIE